MREHLCRGAGGGVVTDAPVLGAETLPFSGMRL
jgi:hypothetical protein